MSFAIPSGIFGTYQDVADYMLSVDGFGKTCKLVYPGEAQVSSVPSIKKNLTMNPGSVNPYNHATPNKPTETTENITLRVYWTEKDFRKVGKFEVPDGTIMTIGNYSDLPKIYRANALLVHTDKIHEEWRFTKFKEPFLWGLLKKNFVCFWTRS